MMIDRLDDDQMLGYMGESRAEFLIGLHTRAYRNGYRLESEIPWKGWAVGDRLVGRGRAREARPVWVWYAYPVKRTAVVLAQRRMAVPAFARMARPLATR